jgi:hypothetical protein
MTEILLGLPTNYGEITTIEMAQGGMINLLKINGGTESVSKEREDGVNTVVEGMPAMFKALRLRPAPTNQQNPQGYKI